MKTKRLVMVATLGALLYVAQVALSFIPNVELISFLILIYTLIFKELTLGAIGIFVVLEGLQWGFGLWWWSYIYVWPLLYFIVNGLKRWISKDESLIWSVVLAFYGLFFGMLFAIVYIPVSISYAFSYFVAGIMFDIIHAVGNFTVCIILYKPIYSAFHKIKLNFQ